MQSLRNAKQIARFVLLWFALSIGAAIASPIVHPQGLQLVCSGAGAVKLLAAFGEGKGPVAGHTLDCPLCASTSAPLPLDVAAFASVSPLAFAVPAMGSDAFLPALSVPPPARGPPVRA